MIQSNAGKKFFFKRLSRSVRFFGDRLGICEALGFMAVSLVLFVMVASAT